MNFSFVTQAYSEKEIYHLFTRRGKISHFCYTASSPNFSLRLRAQSDGKFLQIRKVNEEGKQERDCSLSTFLSHLPSRLHSFNCRLELYSEGFKVEW